MTIVHYTPFERICAVTVFIALAGAFFLALSGLGYMTYISYLDGDYIWTVLFGAIICLLVAIAAHQVGDL